MTTAFFIKCERHGINLAANPLGTIVHLKNWAVKAFSGFDPMEGGLVTRRETDKQSDLKEAFLSVLSAVKEAESATKDPSLSMHTDKTLTKFKRTFQRVAIVQNIKRALYEGKDPATIEASPLLKKLAQSIAAFEEIVSHIPHADVVSGHEVLVESSSLSF